MRQEMQWARYKKWIVFLHTIDNEPGSTLHTQNNEKLTNAMKNWRLQLELQLPGPQRHTWPRINVTSCALNTYPEWRTGCDGERAGGNASSCTPQLNFCRRAHGEGKTLPEDRILTLSFRGQGSFVLRFLTETQRKGPLQPGISAHH